ncbi:hypothetical protein F4810DRAFT_684271, partial [Camillea tinctor]
MALSTCTGPIIGGALTEYVGWRWCFWVNVLAGACVLIIIFLFVDVSVASPESQPAQNLTLREKIKHMDFPGLILFLGAVCCPLLVL